MSRNDLEVEGTDLWGPTSDHLVSVRKPQELVDDVLALSQAVGSEAAALPVEDPLTR
jgi:hypothetical protein